MEGYAAGLGRILEEEAARSGGLLDVTLLAHSTGGLISSYYAEVLARYRGTHAFTKGCVSRQIVTSLLLGGDQHTPRAPREGR